MRVSPPMLKQPDAAGRIYAAFVDAIVTGHLKRGARLPTMQRIAEENGVTFRVARSVVERLGREGYVKSYPHIGTIVRAKKHMVWRGRILFVSFDDDSSSYFVTRVADALRRHLVAEGYLMTPIVASRLPRGDVSQLKTALGQSVDCVVLMYSAPHLERLVAATGFPYVVIYGCAPSRPNAWTIPFDISEPIARFVDHCRRAGIGSVAEVNFNEKAFPSAVRELKVAGILTRELVIEPLARYGRYEGIERAAMEMFLKLPISEFPDLFLIWDDFVAQGVLTALLTRGLADRARIVVQTNKGLGPVWPKSLTRFECDGASVGEKVAAFVLGILAKGRLPPVPRISPTYVFGESFPWK